MAAVRRVAPQVSRVRPGRRRHRAPGGRHTYPLATSVRAACGRSVLRLRADQVCAPHQPSHLRRSVGRRLAQRRERSGDRPPLPKLNVVATADPREVDAGVGGQCLSRGRWSHVCTLHIFAVILHRSYTRSRENDVTAHRGGARLVRQREGLSRLA